MCAALNDALLDGLLTVIHSEGGGDGMSSLQVSWHTPVFLSWMICAGWTTPHVWL